ncbi:MAG TPA: response regulator transcription factor [Thermoanaerobaculia bacterium]|nr:response regulator transcription factor [Thermoanaerobaculia bacterium]
MDSPVRVLVVADHFVVRKGVCALLADDKGIVVVGEAGDGTQAIEEAWRLRPQVILMDLRLPGLDGVAVTREILAEQPQMAVVALTDAAADDEALDAVEAGALGCLAKASPPEDFLAAIHRVARGDAWLPPHLTRGLLARLKPRPSNVRELLTEREREVLALVAQGQSNRNISQSLSITEITVRTHVSHILGKLGVSNRVEAALYAVRSSNKAGLPGS